MAGFVQIIEYRTSRIDEVQTLVDKYRADAGNRSNTRRVSMTADRDNQNTYVTIAEFDSYEAAMENSNLPETTEFAAQMAQLCDGPPVFRNLDVVLVDER